MYKLKQVPEDFIVKEADDLILDEDGEYSYFLLKKRNYNTLNAIQAIAEKLKINEKSIGFAGNKDRKAVTEQAISIKNGNKSIENIKIKDIELKYLGRGSEAVYLGGLKGNDFTITIRNLEKQEIKVIKDKSKKNEIVIPNFFGPQRFSSENQSIGGAIIKTEFKEAVRLVISTNSEFNDKIEEHLKKNPHDFVVALKRIPFRLLKLYIHSYQSYLFNKILEEYSNSIWDKKIKRIDLQLPIIGFGTEVKNKDTKEIIDKVLKDENIAFRDFIVRAIPDLSSEGSERSAFLKINNFEIIESGKDDLNENKEKITVKFYLPKGAYATVLIEQLFA
jgi:tRNA pseudouridine13 synthase